jgi:two-component system, NtrC family, response regulator PilR
MNRILVVDDESSIREFLTLLLKRTGKIVESASNFAEAEAALKARSFDLVISDFKLGQDSGLEVLKLAKSIPQGPEVIIITAYGTAASAVEAMRKGAYDYIAKPFDNEELKLLIDRAIEKKRLNEEIRNLKATLLPKAQYLVGTSQAMANVWSLVDKVAQAKGMVLIAGESGTGKEVVARAIHTRSPRSAAQFVPMNCGALNEGVLESELFGHVKGSFTGANQDRVGLLVSAGQGTVLLDEVGEMPMGTQVKLLRVLQERMVKPVGSSKEIPFEARVIAATNKKLDEEVKAGRFREDLFFRLNVITIELPPLRDRREDIVPLAEYFLSRVSEELGRPGMQFLPTSLQLLQKYSFSGNVRQLHNIVERAATLADGMMLGPDSLPASVRGEVETYNPEDLKIGEGFSLDRLMDGIERRHLTEALKRSNGVKMRAAEILGLSFRSFRYRLAKHGMGEE